MFFFIMVGENEMKVYWNEMIGNGMDKKKM